MAEYYKQIIVFIVSKLSLFDEMHYHLILFDADVVQI